MNNFCNKHALTRDRFIGPKNLLDDLINFARTNPDKIEVKKYDVKTNQEVEYEG